MSRKFLKKYSNFNREILMEFLSPQQLDELDRSYNLAKAERALRRLRIELKIVDPSQSPRTNKPKFFSKILDENTEGQDNATI